MLSSTLPPRMRQARPGLLMLLIVALIGLAPRLNAQTVATYGFEDGTADGWSSFYNATTPIASNALAHTGSYSLYTVTSATGTGGPTISLNTVLQAGAQYTITGWVQLAPGMSAQNANFTIHRTDPTCSGGSCYDTIGAYTTAVTDSGWVQIGGSYTVSTTETGLQLYAQLVGASTAVGFYLDDVVITETAPPPGGTPVASYNFSGGVDGWTPFGPVTVNSVASPLADPTGNAYSLETTGRTAGYMGPGLNLLSVNNVVAGATYQVTAYVLLAAADATNPTATLSLKSADCATTGAYSSIATSAALSNAQWTKVQGTFSFSNLPGPPTSLTLYVQSSSPTDSFYISGVTISQLAPPPINPSQQDNSGISSTFEDGTADGWTSRSGSSTVAASSATAHTGTESLLTTGRIANWDGPSISVSNKMYVGSVYNVSVWIKTAVTDSASHIFNISLQTVSGGTTSYPGVSGYPGVSIPDDGAWHQIVVNNYTMSSPYDQGQATLYIQTVPTSGTDTTSFYIDDFQLSYVAPPTIQTNIPSIFKTLASDFTVGAAVDPTDLSGAHAQLLNMHFDSMTPGNELKWSSTEPSLGTYDYVPGDSLVGEATCSNTLVRGQNLVWATGAQTPSYAFGDGTNSAANQATVTSNIQEHIMNEVQHFGTHVYAWDVINEPLDPSQPDCLVHGPFYQVLGKSYMDVALKAARLYAPKGTKLFINEYSTADPNRLACLVKVVADLRSRGVPLDGIGHETHSAINYPTVPAVVKAIETVHRNFPDLDQQITEFDLSVYNAGDNNANYGSNIPPAVLAEQGWLYEQYFDAFRRLGREGKIKSVTIWGMADDDTWLDSFPVTRTDYPLPFDMQLQAKPAYWGIVDETQLPGYGLHFEMTEATGTGNTRTFTLTAKNGSAGVAYTTQISGLTLRQVDGPRCSPTITTPAAFPLNFGDIPAGGTAQTTVTINVTGCRKDAAFELMAPWSNAVYHTGTFVHGLALRADHDDRDDRDDHHDNGHDNNNGDHR